MSPLVLYHATSPAAAQAILADGFRDATGRYMAVVAEPFTGVWLSNVPLDCNDGAKGNALLEVTLDLSEADLADYEWVEEGDGMGHREWLVPASVINPRMALRLVPDEERWADAPDLPEE